MFYKIEPRTLAFIQFIVQFSKVIVVVVSSDLLSISHFVVLSRTNFSTDKIKNTIQNVTSEHFRTHAT